jgi:hypothetical protein
MTTILGVLAVLGFISVLVPSGTCSASAASGGSRPATPTELGARRTVDYYAKVRDSTSQ